MRLNFDNQSWEQVRVGEFRKIEKNESLPAMTREQYCEYRAKYRAAVEQDDAEHFSGQPELVDVFEASFRLAPVGPRAKAMRATSEHALYEAICDLIVCCADSGDMRYVNL